MGKILIKANFMCSMNTSIWGKGWQTPKTKNYDKWYEFENIKSHEEKRQINIKLEWYLLFALLINEDYIKRI